MKPYILYSPFVVVVVIAHDHTEAYTKLCDRFGKDLVDTATLEEVHFGAQRIGIVYIHPVCNGPDAGAHRNKNKEQRTE